ncbi:MAG: carbohydrate-binding family 9-like protein [Akkermansia sp.]|nr:carbohydrate-binding family 9-like protein [Akkermansia sp.]
MRARLIPLFMSASIAAAALPPVPPTYVCQRATQVLCIDGRGDETNWQQALRLSPLRDIEGAAIPHATDIRLLWDDRYLYVLADMQEPHLRATLTERDSVIYHDPDFEVFIDPDGDTRNYVELEINALNTVWDLLLTAPYRTDNLALHDWNMPGLKHAVHLRGTLNNPADTDIGWSVELAIPWESITGHSNHPRRTQPPAPGTTLRMNFSRVNWQVQADATAPSGYKKLTNAQGTPLPESNHVWAPTGVINIHCPEHWGYVKLSDRPAGSGYESMPVPPTDAAQRRLFAYYNAQLAHRAEHGEFSTTLCHEGISPLLLTPQHFVAQTLAPNGQQITLDSHGQLTTTPPTNNRPPLYLWVQGGKHEGNSTWWQQHFATIARAGVQAVIIGGSTEQLAHLTPLARQQGLQVYAWLWALNRPQDATALQNPPWYAVNRLGKSCHAPADRPYVEYYQFLCPNNNEVLRHLLQEVDKLAAIPGLSGIQLDYMRLPDVILPRGLWEKYGLVMDRELPEYDYCYCDNCKALFAKQFNREINIDSDKDADWREFRLASVARVANTLSERIRSHNLRAACAVFPTPEISAQLVRQDWARFRLDLALPMVYYSFYNEGDAWAADCSQNSDIQCNRRLPIAPGLHLPDTTPQQLPAELDRLRTTSPAGIGLFCDDQLTPDMLEAIRKWK